MKKKTAIEVWKKKRKFKEAVADERVLKSEVENYEAKIKFSFNKLEENLEKRNTNWRCYYLNAINLCK
jgi:hypothetical protein